MSGIRAFVENVIYYNEDNGYAVLEVSEGNELFTMTGHFPYISAGDTVSAEGEFVVHPVYGSQFSCTSFSIVKPESEDMVERYLSSGAVKGIGPAMAKKIVKKFKADTFRIMEEEPERLAEIKGISLATAMKISEQVEMKRGFRDALMYMQQFGIGTNLAHKIYETYGPALYNVLEKRPYRLADDIDGIGFRLADTIAQNTGIAADSPARIRCGVVYVLRDAVTQGHTWLPKDVLLRMSAELLEITPEMAEEQLLSMQIEDKIVLREKTPEDVEVYLSACYYVERDIAFRLDALNIRGESDADFVDRRLKEVSEKTGLTLDPMQAAAVRASVDNGIVIITGGPGTGKTTTIRNLISYYEKDNRNIMLAAPTGRAAKRMTEATGCEAKTIHRLLEYTGAPPKDDDKGTFESYGGSGNAGGAGSTDGKGRFLRDEKDPLECDVLIIDETSMVDIFLMDALLKAIVPGTRVIFAGDANQLPSVGAGNVLKDMISSGAFTTVRLTHIFRQAAESDIVLNAHRINEGEPVDLSKKSRDFLFIRGQDPASISGYIKTLITKKLPPYVDADVYDIQVLTPTRKGALGVEVLNKELQAFLNPPSAEKKEKRLGDILFREGDKVMQIKNDYDIEWTRVNEKGVTKESGSGVFNGDMGKIVKINEHTETVRILFDDGRIADYAGKSLRELDLSYAVTVHKSQGSEYPAVVIPMYYGPAMLMNRNLLYTAVTRAKKCVCLVGLPQVFCRMAENQSESRRYSGLRDRILEL